MPYSALVDSNTYQLLTVSRHIAAVVFVSKCTPDSLYISSVDHPNYLKKKYFWGHAFPLAQVSSATYPQWRWDMKTRLFERAPEHMSTESIFAKSALAHQKQEAISYIMYNLSASRQRLRTGVEFQETTHMLRYLEALEFKKNGGDQAEDPLRFPFLLQYAAIERVSLSQAADDILFQARTSEDVLLRSEAIRLKYFKAMSEASASEEVLSIFKKFNDDNFVAAQI